MKSLSLLSVWCGSRSTFEDFPIAPTRSVPPLCAGPPCPLDDDDLPSPQAAIASTALSPRPA